MLEHSALLLHPADASGRGLISAPETEEPLGHAFWWSPGMMFPGRGVLQIHEYEDEPLLCSIRRIRAELPWCDVFDARPRRIGRVLGPVLLDEKDQFWALAVAGIGQAVFISAEGQPLAGVSWMGAWTILSFGKAVEGEPFVKMRLLGATLLATTDPERWLAGAQFGSRVPESPVDYPVGPPSSRAAITCT